MRPDPSSPQSPSSSDNSPAPGTMTVGIKERLHAFFTMPNTRIYSSKRFHALGAIALVAVGLSFVLPAGKTETAKAEVAQQAALDDGTPKFDLSRDDIFLIDGSFDRLSETRLTLQPGQNLGPLLQDNGVPPQTAYQVTKAFATVYEPRRLRAGQDFMLSFEGDDFKGLTFKPDVERTVFVSRADSDTYSAYEVAAELKFDHMKVVGTIENSLYLDASRLGAPDKVIQQFANIYEYSVDFQRDIRKGDAFELFFEVSRDNNGDVVKARNLLFTSFSPRGRTLDYYLFEDDKGRENFYDAEGKTAKRKLRATPVNGARLSSSFGNRRHPVLGYAKMHKGIDFAAPRGTPIMAAGNGTVVRANRFGSFGNYIKIRHSDGYDTAYAHLQGFARGIKSGAYVTQDQIIGYVGTTGRSTGPHLHYEVHKNGRAINPRTLNQLSGKPIRAEDKPKFDARRKMIDAMRGDFEVAVAVAEGFDPVTLAPGQGVLLSAEASEPMMPAAPE